MSDRRFRFGVQAHQAPDGPGWTGFAQRAEELGYSTLLVMDHFGDQLLAAVPGAEAVVLDSVTHSLPIERPDLVVEILDDFLSSVPPEGN